MSMVLSNLITDICHSEEHHVKLFSCNEHNKDIGHININNLSEKQTTMYEAMQMPIVQSKSGGCMEFIARQYYICTLY